MSQSIHTHIKNIFLNSRALIDAEKLLDSEESCEPPSKKRKLSNMETERIIMGEELDDMHINLAVRLLTTQFPDLSCLKSTLLQQMSPIPVLEKKSQVLQIINCSSRHHWVVATNIGSKTEGCVTQCMIQRSRMLTQKLEKSLMVCSASCLWPKSRLLNFKSKRVKKDHGLFAIAYATALVYGHNLCEILPKVHAIPFGQLHRERRSCTLSLRTIYTIIH